MNEYQIWVVIAFAIIVAAVFIFILAKKGGKIETKYGNIVIDQEGIKNKNPQIQKIIDRLHTELKHLRQVLVSDYLKLLRSKRPDIPNLEEFEDFMFYDQCLGNIIYSGNGIHSIKTVLEKALFTKEYLKKNRGDEFDSCISEIVNECFETTITYLKHNYRTTYMSQSKEMCQRLVTNIELYDSIKELTPSLIEETKDLFVYCAIVERGEDK